MEFSRQLSLLMERNNISDGVLAKYVGVTRQSVMGWKKGSIPTVDKLQKIAEFFEIPISIFGYSFSEMKPNTNAVPIVGSIRAGYPVESYETIEGYVSLPTGVNYSEDLFALTVVGDSMMPLVMEGDIIICDKRIDQANGKICAVTVDGESTLKRVKTDSTGVTLIPTNPMYKEIHYTPKKAEEKGFHIDGVLVQMIRNF